MPSRKKAKGQARKAKAAEKLAKPISLVTWNGCRHGGPPSLPCGRLCVRFVHAYWNVRGDDDTFFGLQCAYASLDTFYALQCACEQYPGALTDDANRKIIIDYFLARGAEMMVATDKHPHWKTNACASAAAVLVLEHFGCCQHKDLCDDIWNDLFHTDEPCMKNQDIVQGCERSLTRFFSKRASCSCLDEKYAAMKSQPKTCICMNCAQMKERRSMMYCTGCSSTQYCSRECQVAHFPHHKEFCKRRNREDRLSQQGNQVGR